MSYQVTIMYLVAAVLTVVGAWMLVRLRSSRITERKVYAYRMVGIMLVSAGIVLAMSSTAMWNWSLEP
jgi:protein-S-isoprenylcysteine O-methyltransferase Ste14